MVSFIISLLQDWAASFTHCFKQSLGKNSRILFWKWTERVVIPLPWNEAVLFGGISRVKLFLGERGKKKTSQWCLLPSPSLPSLEKRSCWGCAVSYGRVPVYLPVFSLQLRFCQIVNTTGKTLQGLKKKYQHHIVMILYLISYIWFWSIEGSMPLFKQCIKKWD